MFGRHFEISTSMPSCCHLVIILRPDRYHGGGSSCRGASPGHPSVLSASSAQEDRSNAMPLHTLIEKVSQRKGLPADEAKQHVLYWLAHNARLAGDQQQYMAAWELAKAAARDHGSRKVTGRDLSIAIRVLRAKNSNCEEERQEHHPQPHDDTEERHATTEACDAEPCVPASMPLEDKVTSTRPESPSFRARAPSTWLPNPMPHGSPPRIPNTQNPMCHEVTRNSCVPGYSALPETRPPAVKVTSDWVCTVANQPELPPR